VVLSVRDTDRPGRRAEDRPEVLPRKLLSPSGLPAQQMQAVERDDRVAQGERREAERRSRLSVDVEHIVV
jgi:hypothetical protein